jgi:Tol biopolymer transport system component
MRLKLGLVVALAILGSLSMPAVGQAAVIYPFPFHQVGTPVQRSGVARGLMSHPEVRPPTRQSPPVVPPASLRLVLAAYRRDATGNVVGPQALFTANGDGSGLVQISPNDGRFYDWPTWALNGTKIVYTAGPPDSDQQVVYMANPDGSEPIALTNNPWLDAQPKISPDGRFLLFTSEWPNEFPKIAIYKMDLRTLQVQNLTARTFAAGLDADPRYSKDGSQIVFASSFTVHGPSNTQIYLMNADGTNRRRLTHDAFFDTDPAISPDGRYVIYSSYQGKDQPIPGQPNNGFKFGVKDWHLMSLDTMTGVARSLTGGKDCSAVTTEVCTPTDGSAWVPVFSPDGRYIAYQSITSPLSAGLYIMAAGGSGATKIIQGSNLAISYWDWVAPGTAPVKSVANIGSAVPVDQLLFGGSVFHSGAVPPPQLFWSQPDRFVSHQIVPKTSQPLAVVFARWFPDKKHIIFVAKVPFNPGAAAPWPAPPSGQTRHIHFTLPNLFDTFVAPRNPADVAQDQIFMMDADGSHVRQLTNPWIEDYMDALQDGDARGNTDPDVSPDGRYVIFTNTSSLRYESFVLRLDLVTGQVMNLTNVTAGAVPVADYQPRYSPDGRQIAFVSTQGGSSHITLMHADGSHVKVVTDDNFFESYPTWSPDGRSLAFGSFRAYGLPITFSDDTTGDLIVPKVRLDSWYLVTLDIASGVQTVLTRAQDTPTLRPVWSPDGTRIAYITVGLTNGPDIYIINATGGVPIPLQLTLDTKEEYVDWR